MIGVSELSFMESSVPTIMYFLNFFLVCKLHNGYLTFMVSVETGDYFLMSYLQRTISTRSYFASYFRSSLKKSGLYFITYFRHGFI